MWNRSWNERLISCNSLLNWCESWIYFLVVFVYENKNFIGLTSDSGKSWNFKLTFSMKKPPSVLIKIISNLTKNSCISILKYLISLVCVRWQFDCTKLISIIGLTTFEQKKNFWKNFKNIPYLKNYLHLKSQTWAAKLWKIRQEKRCPTVGYQSLFKWFAN